MWQLTSENVYGLGLVTYVSWSSDFVKYLKDYLMDDWFTWGIGSV